MVNLALSPPLDVGDLASTSVEWIEEQGEFSFALMTLLISVWVVLCLPSSIVEPVPGFLYGFRRGFLVAFLGKSFGSLLCVLIARFVIRPSSLRNKVFNRFKVLPAIERAVSRDGFRMLLLIRVLYLPLPVKNYGLGMMNNIKFWKIPLAFSISGYLISLPPLVSVSVSGDGGSSAQ